MEGGGQRHACTRVRARGTRSRPRRRSWHASSSRRVRRSASVRRASRAVTRPHARDGLGHPDRSARRVGPRDAGDRGARVPRARADRGRAIALGCASTSRARIARGPASRPNPPRGASRARERGTPRREPAGSGKLKSRAGPGAGDAFAPAEGLLGAHGQDGGAEASHLSCRLGGVGCRTEVECASMAPRPGRAPPIKSGMRANARSPDVPLRSRKRIVSPDWWKTILRQPGVLGVYRRVKKPAEAGEKLCFESLPPSGRARRAENANTRSFGSRNPSVARGALVSARSRVVVTARVVRDGWARSRLEQAGGRRRRDDRAFARARRGELELG